MKNVLLHDVISAKYYFLTVLVRALKYHVFTLKLLMTKIKPFPRAVLLLRSTISMLDCVCFTNALYWEPRKFFVELVECRNIVVFTIDDSIHFVTGCLKDDAINFMYASFKCKKKRKKRR